MTVCGAIRIVGNPECPNPPVSTAVVVEFVTPRRTAARPCLLADDVSLVDADYVDASEVLTSAQVIASQRQEIWKFRA